MGTVLPNLLSTRKVVDHTLTAMHADASLKLLRGDWSSSAAPGTKAGNPRMHTAESPVATRGWRPLPAPSGRRLPIDTRRRDRPRRVRVRFSILDDPAPAAVPAGRSGGRGQAGLLLRVRPGAAAVDIDVVGGKGGRP